MMALETSSSENDGRPGFLLMASMVHHQAPAVKAFGGVGTKDFVARMFHFDGIACRGTSRVARSEPSSRSHWREPHGVTTTRTTPGPVPPGTAQGRRGRGV